MGNVQAVSSDRRWRVSEIPGGWAIETPELKAIQARVASFERVLRPRDPLDPARWVSGLPTTDMGFAEAMAIVGHGEVPGEFADWLRSTRGIRDPEERAELESRYDFMFPRGGRR